MWRPWGRIGEWMEGREWDAGESRWVVVYWVGGVGCGGVSVRGREMVGSGWWPGVEAVGWKIFWDILFGFPAILLTLRPQIEVLRPRRRVWEKITPARR